MEIAVKKTFQAPVTPCSAVSYSVDIDLTGEEDGDFGILRVMRYLEDMNYFHLFGEFPERNGRDEAAILLEDVLDTLTEVGNGATDEDLQEARKKLLTFRDLYFL